MYQGTSCQNPAEGYYRHKDLTSETSHFDYEQYIGRSVPCQCNGRSNKCNRETGYCEVKKLAINFFIQVFSPEIAIFLNFCSLDVFE